jgi:hypothetical protein
MFKSLLSVCSIVVLLLSSLIIPNRAIACPVKLPESLLSLYRNSEAIYVARFDKIADQEIVENTDERIVIKIKKYFDISSALKGENRKLLVLDETDYRYKAAEPEVADVEEEDDVSDGGGYRAGNLKSGDLLLIFVKKDESGKQLVLTDWRDGIKKMTSERLDAYQARIRELNTIFAAKKIDDAEIVEWLVRTAEDPITRWEGAFDLQMSQSALNLEEEEKKEAEENSQSSENASDTFTLREPIPVDEGTPVTSESQVEELIQPQAKDEGEAAGDEPPSGFDDRTIWARLLTDSHKQRLMDALMAGRSDRVDAASQFSSGDRELLDLVSSWGDTKFARFLLDRVPGSAGDPGTASDLMSKIATILDDKELDSIVEKYSEYYYQNDDEEVEEKGSEEDESSAETNDAETNSGSEEAPAKLTYKDVRQQLMSKFMERVVVSLALADSRDAERAAR